MVVCRTFAADFGYGVDVEILPHEQRVGFEYRGFHADRLSDDDDVAVMLLIVPSVRFLPTQACCITEMYAF